MKVKLSGLMKPCRVAKKQPAKPPNIAPMAKAESLTLVGLMPSARQAISSSRNASQARPTGSRRMRKVKKLVISASARITIIEKDHAVVGREFEARTIGESRAASGADGRTAGRRRSAAGCRRCRSGRRYTRPVQQHDADDLAEAERDDRQIVAAQPQHRKAEQRPRSSRPAMPANGSASQKTSRDRAPAARRYRRRPRRTRHSRGRAGRRDRRRY